MAELSVLILTKNEEKNLPRAIESVKDIASEIVVLDSGSTDATVNVAKSLGAKVFYHPWDGYSNQLNRGVQVCSKDWIFVLDADEEVSEELRDSIREAISSNKAEVFMVCRQTYYLGGFLRHAWYPEWRVRLFKKGAVSFEGELHESAVFKGKASKLRGNLYHYSYKNLFDQYEKTIKYAKIMAEINYRKGKKFRIYNLLFNPVWSFFKVFLFQMGFLDGLRGFAVAISAFIYTFLKYIFLLELEMKEKHGEKLWNRR
ncbi:glycosyltransferase family 2 protein [Thermocrinis sp.]|uniref:glycosyltransferase family 2 protein n=1 Tax=Thermocrinis sp. TaxID=2024383 RepID=UPI002FDE2106